MTISPIPGIVTGVKPALKVPVTPSIVKAVIDIGPSTLTPSAKLPLIGVPNGVLTISSPSVNGSFTGVISISKSDTTSRPNPSVSEYVTVGTVPL